MLGGGCRILAEQPEVPGEPGEFIGRDKGAPGYLPLQLLVELVVGLIVCGYYRVSLQKLFLPVSIRTRPFRLSVGISIGRTVGSV
jgi:hypothetical protein